MAEAKSVVVIEDDDDVRGLAEAVLAGSSLEVHAAGDAASGIEAVREHSPHLVVLDYGLPGRDGLAAAEEIRDLCEAPILLLTAREELVRDLPAGIADAIAKPFRVAELRRRALALLGH